MQIVMSTAPDGMLRADWQPGAELLDALAAEALAKLSDFTPQACFATRKWQHGKRSTTLRL